MVNQRPNFGPDPKQSLCTIRLRHLDVFVGEVAKHVAT